jgi:hypothetical protein
MALPKEVQKSKDAAMAAFNAAYPPKMKDGEEGDNAADPNLSNPNATNDATLKVDPSQPNPNPGQNGVDTQPRTDGDASNYKQMYHTLKGKYDAEVPRLQNDLRNLQNELANTQSILASLSDVDPSNPGNGNTATQHKKKLLTDQDIADYGSDLIDVVKRAAMEEVGGQLETLNKENQQLKQKLNEIGAKGAATAKASVYTHLDTAVPNWREINRDEKFLDWLADADLYSGLTRQELLLKAFEQNDSSRVTMFFNNFLSEHTSQSGAKTEPKPRQNTAKVSLDTLVAPGKPNSSGNGDGAPDSKRIYSQADITAFYEKVRKGAYRDKPTERANLERDILAAAAEGRIK